MSDYRLHELIGEGGMGVVYSGEEIYPSGKTRPIACKVMSRRWRDHKKLTNMFRLEAETNQRISEGHDGLVRLYHWFRDQDERDFLIMEFIIGCNLSELLSVRERLSFDVIRLIAWAVLDTLAYVHEQGLVHRDVSPSNVLLSLEGTVKLLDFGLAKPPSLARENEKRKSDFRGKRQYVSPEVLQGQGADIRSDLYSFGSVLYELLSGAPPFGGDVTFEQLQTKLDAWHMPELPERIPSDLRVLTMGLLRRNSDEREPQTAAEARDMLLVPKDPTATQTELRILVDRVHQRISSARAKIRYQGSFAGMRIKSLYITDGFGDKPGGKQLTSPEPRKRPMLWNAALSLFCLIAVAALVLAVYNLQDEEDARPVAQEPTVPEDQPDEMSEPRSPETDGTGEVVKEVSKAREEVPSEESPSDAVSSEADQRLKPSHRTRQERSRVKPRKVSKPRADAVTEPIRSTVGHYSWN